MNKNTNNSLNQIEASPLYLACEDNDVSTIKMLFETGQCTDKEDITKSVIHAIHFLSIQSYEYIFKHTDYFKDLDYKYKKMVIETFIEDWGVLDSLAKNNFPFDTKNDGADYLIKAFNLDFAWMADNNASCKLLLEKSSFKQVFNFLIEVISTKIDETGTQYKMLINHLENLPESQLKKVIKQCESYQKDNYINEGQENIDKNTKLILDSLSKVKLFHKLDKKISNKEIIKKPKI